MIVSFEFWTVPVLYSPACCLVASFGCFSFEGRPCLPPSRVACPRVSCRSMSLLLSWGILHRFWVDCAILLIFLHSPWLSTRVTLLNMAPLSLGCSHSLQRIVIFLFFHSLYYCIHTVLLVSVLPSYFVCSLYILEDTILLFSLFIQFSYLFRGGILLSIYVWFLAVL